MKRITTVLSISVLFVISALGNSDGTRPHSEASKYPISVEKGDFKLGARLLSKHEVMQAFVTDLNRGYVVVEVALYPGKDEIDLANTDFTLQISGLDAEFTPQDPARIAAGVQQTAPAQRQVGIIPYGSVGYESGPRRNDRYGNQTGGRGVRTSVGVGVILDRNPPASTSQDRRVMQQELEDKGLPQGVTDAPIAGYLYFAVEKLPKNAEHQLEYATENGETIVLLLPRK